MNRTLKVRLAAGAAAVLGLSATITVLVGPIAQAKDPGGCSVAKLVGRYGGNGSGVILADNPFGIPAGPFTTNAVIDLKADGTWSGEQVASFNGDADVFPANGTWSVQPNCVFLIRDAEDADQGRGAAVDGEREIMFIDTGKGVSATFDVKRTDAD
jgi:hypothetical protein